MTLVFSSSATRLSFYGSVQLYIYAFPKSPVFMKPAVLVSEPSYDLCIFTWLNLPRNYFPMGILEVGNTICVYICVKAVILRFLKIIIILVIDNTLLYRIAQFSILLTFSEKNQTHVYKINGIMVCNLHLFSTVTNIPLILYLLLPKQLLTGILTLTLTFFTF